MLVQTKGLTGRLRTSVKAVSYFVVASYLAIASVGTLLIPQIVHADGEPTITAGTNITGTVDLPISITGLQIEGDSVDPIPVSLTVPSGSLSMTTTTGLTFFNGVEIGRKLSFTGNKTDLNNALATLKYKTYKIGTVQMSVVVSDQSLVYYPANGHIYEVVDSVGGITWDDAKIAAELRTKNGATGYLATINNADENTYISDRLEGDGWIGASDAGHEGDWQWVTDPDNPVSFWQGAADGHPVEGRFSNWSNGVEPNNSSEGPGENCAQFYSNGSGWNDLECSGGTTLQYYVVEYGSSQVVPVPPSNTTINITAGLPTPVTVPIASCLDLVTIASNPLDHRYDTLTLTQNIDCNGQTVTPLFNETEQDFEDNTQQLPFRGTFTSTAGQNFVISNLTVSDPAADNVGLISYAKGATISNVSIDGGSVEGVSCVGGLVGTANATTFDTVSITMDVNGSYSTGGIVGCFQAYDGDSSLTDSDFTGQVTLDFGNNAGGIAGFVEAVDGMQLDISRNTTTAGLSSPYNVGGIIGYAVAYGAETNITVSQNTATNGVDGGGASSVGGIIGRIQSNDEAHASVSQNTVGNNGVQGGDYTGGQIGRVDDDDAGQITVTSTINSSPVTSTGSNAGGIIGRVDMEGPTAETSFVMNDCVNTGDITADYSAGGLIGNTGLDYGDETILITNSHSSADITATSSQAGGLIGDANGATITESYSAGSVTAEDYTAGGLVGNSSQSTISRSYSTANVSIGSGNDTAGGLVGLLYDSTVEDSYARGNVTGDQFAGGLVGEADVATITNSYSTGLVSSAIESGNVNGLVGSSSESTETNSFWDQETSGQTALGDVGTPLTTEQMKNSQTFTDVNWDFQDTWGITSVINDGYPCLQWSDNACLGIETEFSINSAEDSTPITLSQTGCTTLSTPTTIKESSLSVLDPAYQYPVGFISFSMTGCQTGGSSNITATFTGTFDPAKMVIRKFNARLNSFTTLSSANSNLTTTVTQLNGKPALRVTYQITDGGLLDQDGIANGTIVDPVGIGTNAVSVPNTGLRRNTL